MCLFFKNVLHLLLYFIYLLNVYQINLAYDFLESLFLLAAEKYRLNACSLVYLMKCKFNAYIDKRKEEKRMYFCVYSKHSIF